MTDFFGAGRWRTGSTQQHMREAFRTAYIPALTSSWDQLHTASMLASFLVAHAMEASMKIPNTSSAEVRKRIAAMRAALAKHNLWGVLVPTSDPHLSEYPPSRYCAREWLSGFTGSVGTLVITNDFAGLWVDFRYYDQAELQLTGTGIEMVRLEAAGATGFVQWLAENTPFHSRFAVDGQILGVALRRSLLIALGESQATLVTDIDLVNEIWLDRPALPEVEIWEHAEKFASRPRKDKLSTVRRAMKELGASAHLVSTLDDIAWLFNLRGTDVAYNPVFVAHALIEAPRARIFIDSHKVPSELRQLLARDEIEIRPYGEISKVLSDFPSDGGAILLDPARVTYGVIESIPQNVRVIEAVNPSTVAKSQKTNAELEHIREAMRRDGQALVEFLAWFEGALGREKLTELTIDEKLTGERAKQQDFVSRSFATIAAFNANGANPHYHATQESHAVIEGDGLLLIDSGGQYLCGTTDVTRVVPIGTPSSEQKRDYSLVLKGMINLSRVRFPRGTPAPMLDALARAPIWSDCIDYGHGTCHGVGYFLNVHEGPQAIAPGARSDSSTAMQPGMVTSNEPGIYRSGQWGVRIENLVANVPAPSSEFGEFLQFETLTMCPIDTRCIDLSLMRIDEISWLNEYHAMVQSRLADGLSEEASHWLELRTAPISNSSKAYAHVVSPS